MRLQRHLSSIQPAFSRALSMLLLAFILFGTTVEAAHTHGSLLPANRLDSAAKFLDPANDSTVNTGSPGCGDCLICQLQQHFQATVISAPSALAPLAEATRFIQSHRTIANSRIVVTRIGRAPPQISC